MGHAQKGAEPAAKKRRCNQHLSHKFFASRDELKGSHPHIIDWFDSATQEVKADIINACFTKNGGRWSMDLEKPCFKQAKIRCVCEHPGSLYRTLGVWSFRKLLSLGAFEEEFGL